MIRSSSKLIPIVSQSTSTNNTSLPLQLIEHRSKSKRRNTSILTSSSSKNNIRNLWTSTSTTSTTGNDPNLIPILDPIKLLSKELGLIRNNVKKLLGSGHPALDTIAKYYFTGSDGGKHLRPLIVLLMSQATNGLSPNFKELKFQSDQNELKEAKELNEDIDYNGINEPLSKFNILNDSNPDLLSKAKSFISNPLSTLASSTYTSSSTTSTSTISLPSSTTDSYSPTLLLPTQRRLAEITEMIHVASLLHDDVIDLAETRRSAPSAPSLFGNKLTILAGDFLLARASMALSRLGSNEVVELVASILANLVEGEVMQMKGNTPDGSSISKRNGNNSTTLSPEIMEHYMKKTYLKTASLIAKSTRATTILGGCGTRQGWVEGEIIKDLAYDYGRNIGIAFQLVDDMLDFTASAAELGKPGQGADLKLGLATAPTLFAWEEFPQLGKLIDRKFSEDGDVDEARYLISKSSGAERTAALALEHSNLARKALEGLPDSEAKTALDELARDTLKRGK